MFNVSFGDRKILMNLVKKRIPSPNKTVVPRELQTEEDVDRLLNVYMSHPMWNDKQNIRDMFKAILSNGDYLTRILTTSDNFLDDTANVKRCFLSNLISTLQMMGEDVTLFESGSFEGINDLRDFVRLLSMNHTELIGHVVKEDLDIRVRNDVKGKNVGEELHVGDTIRINTNGKIDKVNNQLVIFDEGVDVKKTTFEYFKEIFEKTGYKFPEVVLWNVRARSVHFPVLNGMGVKLVSGASPKIIEMVTNGDFSDTYQFMVKCLEKYSCFDEIIIK
jgi:hypothetical protein